MNVSANAMNPSTLRIFLEFLLALGLVNGEELNPDLLGDLDLMYAQVLVVVAAPAEEESMTTLSVGLLNNIKTPLMFALQKL